MTADKPGLREAPDPPVPTTDQEAELQTVAAAFLRRLDLGDPEDATRVIAEHPELRPFLSQRLNFLLEVHRLKREQEDREVISREGYLTAAVGLEQESVTDGDPTLESTQSLQRGAEAFGSEQAREIHCPHCGHGIHLLRDSVAEVTCRNCGSSFHVDPVTSRRNLASPGPAASLQRIGRFQTLEVVGRGGFGVVYKAIDPELNRLVALKIPRAGYFLRSEEEERFVREARHAANLCHPGIVRVYEVARTSQLPYIVTEFIEGETLADQLTSRTVSHRAMVELLVQVAEALHYAHEQRVIHRDIKPSNILVDRSGHPYIADFGLARKDDVDVTINFDGEVLGTPTFMSPEQASGEPGRIDRRTDVYSLGVILYRALTGELPFRGTRQMLVHQILNDEPKPPRRINHVIPRDLETITLKAMAKEPGRRYATAEDFADDLRRWLRGEPILARPVGRAERSVRWCRRNPMVAAMVACIGALLLFITGLAASWALREQRFHEHTKISFHREKLERTRAELNATLSRQRLGQFLESQGIERLRNNDSLAALPWLVEALALEDPADDGCQQHRLRLAMIFRNAPQLRHCFGVPGDLRYATVSESGEWVAAGSSDGAVLLANLLTGMVVANPPQHTHAITKLAFRGDSKALVSSSVDNTARLWMFAEQPGVIYTLNHNADVLDVGFTADGSRVVTASADKTIQIWNAADGMRVEQPLKHEYPVIALAVSPDDQHLWAVTWDQARSKSSVIRWDLATRTREGDPWVRPGYTLAMQLSPDGRTLVRTGDTGDVALYRTQERTSIDLTDVHDGVVSRIQFSPDGTRFTTVDEAGVQLFDASTGALIETRIPQDGPNLATAISQCGGYLAAGGLDGVLRLWNLTTARVMTTEIRHGRSVVAAAFLGNDRSLLTASADGSIKLWDLTNVLQTPPSLHQETILRVEGGSSGKRLVTASRDHTAGIWDVATPTLLSRLTHDAAVRGVTISSDERWVATASDDKTARIWNLADGTSAMPPLNHPAPVTQVTFHPGSALLATSCEDGRVRLFDLATGQKRYEIEHGGKVHSFAFSPDGDFLASASDDRSARVWHVSDGTPAGPPLTHRDSVRVCDFSRDGLWLVTGSDDQMTVVWDWRSGEPVNQLPPMRGAVRAVDFSPRDDLFLAVGDDECALLRHVSPLGMIPRLCHHNASLRNGKFSPDGTVIVIAGGDAGRAGALRQEGDGFAMLWDAERGVPLSPALRHPAEVTDAEFLAGSDLLVTATASGMVRTWSLAADERSVDELRQAARAWSGFTVTAAAELIPVPAEEQARDFQPLAAAAADPERVRPAGGPSLPQDGRSN